MTFEGWELAKGSAGYTGPEDVYGRYENGVALFAFTTEDHDGRDVHRCGVTGQCTVGGKTLEEAMQNGVDYARKWGVREADRRLTRAQFQQRMNDPERGR